MASELNNLEEENRMKKHWKLSLILLVLLVGVAGATLWFTVGRNWTANQSTGDAYTAYVQDEKGTSLEKVYVMLCAEDGTEITWLPYVTNTSGKVQFVEGVEEGCYVKVVGVPLGYKLDESVKYEFDESKNVKITLVEDDSVYVAKIDETKFMSFASALSVANASSEDVTIELMADAVINTGTVKNAYGKTIIVNGNGHTVTTEGGNNAFLVNQEEGLVAFENMNIVHKNTGATFQVNALVTLSLTDVSIDATKGSAYNYALINTLAVDGTTTLNMTRVDIKMAVQTPAKANEAGIIRTGNTSGTKTVDINLKECNFDTEEATGRQCIVVMKNTVANIKATKCSFKAGDSPAIWAAEQSKMQTLVMNGSKAVSTISPSSAAPIKGYAAMIGNTYYLTFAHAAEVTAKSKSDVTIKAVTDVTMKTCTIKNEHGKLITIDGNGKTITTSGGSNAFILGNNVAFKNMKVNHKNTGSVFHMTSTANLKATDVTINATEGSNYNYTLVNTLAEGETTVDFKRVNVKMAVEKKGSDKYASIIRTGNEAEKKTVVIKLTDCNFDTIGATGRSGIAIVPNTKATVELKNTTIATMDNFAIRSNEQDIIWNNADTKLTSLQKEYQDYPVEYYLAKIGDVFYTLKQAIAVANAAKVDTQINLLANYTIKSYTINNKAGKLVTLNGDGKKITTSGGSNALVVEGGKFALKNIAINHKNTGSVVQIVENANVDLEKVEVSATEGKSYDWALFNIPATGDGTTLKMKDVNVAMSVAGRGKSRDSAIIRTGNDSEKKTVVIELIDSNFDTTKATDRSGIVVMNATTADIKLTNSTITTLDVAPIKAKASLEGNKLTKDENTVLDSKTTEFNKENAPIRGYQAKVGNVSYGQLKTALSVAKAGETVTLLQNISSGWRTISKSVVLDGNGYTITSTKNGTTDKNDKKLFVLKQAATDVTFKNMEIIYRRSGSMIEVEGQANVKLENVNVDATQSENGYEYALINMVSGGKSNLTMTNVDVKMSTNIAAKATEAGVIRTGNEIKYGGSAKEISIVLNDCTLDTTEAAGRHGVAIIKDTTAKIELNNTKIKTKNVSAIKSYETRRGQVTVTDDEESLVVCGNGSARFSGYAYKEGNVWYVATPEDVFELARNATEDFKILLKANLEYALDTLKNPNAKITIDTNGYTLTATTDNADVNVISKDKVEVINIINKNKGEVESKVLYTTFQKALELVKEDGTIKLLRDVVESTGSDAVHTIKKEITIDGNENKYKITSESGVNNLFRTEKDVTFKNMTIAHNGYGAAIQVNQASTLTAIDVAIDAKNPGKDGYKYALINITAKQAAKKDGEKEEPVIPEVNLDFTNVKVDMDVTTAGDKAAGSIIRTGNNNEVKIVNINLKDCELDATGAIGRYGIVVMNGTTSTITLDERTKVLSSDVSAIRTYNEVDLKTEKAGQVIVSNDSVVSSIEAEQFEGYKYQIDNVVYEDGILEELATGLKDAKIIMNDDMTCDLSELEDGVTIDTNGYTLTATGTNANVTIENYEAQVGNQYTTFKHAVEIANAATKSVTIQVVKDVTFDSVTLINEVEQKIILKGNGNKFISNSGKNNTFVIGKNVELNNMTIVHKNTGSAIQITEAGTVKATDVTIDATYSNYNFALINVMAKGNTTLDFTRVDVTMVADGNTNTEKAIVRTGNNGEAKNVTINLKGCVLDATGADGRHGIMVMKDTESTISLDKDENGKATEVKSGNVSAIRYYVKDNTKLSQVTVLNGSMVESAGAQFEGYTYQIGDTRYAGYDLTETGANQTVTLLQNVSGEIDLKGAKDFNIVTNGYTLKTKNKDASVEVAYNTMLETNDTEPKSYYNISEADTNSLKKNYQAQIDNKLYKNYSDAVKFVNATDEAIIETITLLKDITDGWRTVSKSVVIDGNGHTITSTKDSATDANDTKLFALGTNAKNVTLKNMNIIFKRSGNLVEVKGASNVHIENVNVDATQSEKGYQFALVNLLGEGESNLTMTNVNVKMAAETKAEAIICTGKDNVNKTVNISLTGCTLDTTEVTGTHGISIIQNTDATIELNNTKIMTKDVSAIKSYETSKGQATVSDDSLLLCGNNQPGLENYVIQVGNTWYVVGPDDILTADTTMTNAELDALSVAVNTNGHCLTVPGGATDESKIVSEAKMQIGSGTDISYLSLQDALERAEVAKDNVAITVRTDSEVDVTGIGNVNGYTITVDTGDYDVTVKGNIERNVIIGEVYIEGTESKVYMSMDKALANQPTVYMNRDLEKDSLNPNTTVTVNTNGYKLTVGDLNGVAIDSEASIPVGEKTAYLTLEDAIKEASASDVTVTVRKAFIASRGYVIGSQAKIDSECKITIDGGNFAITPAEGVEALFTVNHTGDVTFKDVKINAGDVSGCKGILITSGEKITLENPSITTKDALGVDNQSTALVKRTRGTDGSIGTITSNIKYKVGDAVCNTYCEALDLANQATAEVSIELWSDMSDVSNTDKIDGVEQHNISNVNGRTITIDGNSCSLTLGNNSKNAFDINSKTVFKDLVLIYSGKAAVIRVEQQVDTSLVNIDMYTTTKQSDITTTKQYYRGTINLLASGTYKLTLTDVNVITKDVTDDGEKLASINNYDSGKEYRGIIVTGNNSSSQPKNITIEITNSKLDARQAKGRFGIYIRGYDNANISLVNSAIMTDNTPNTSGVKTNVIYAQAYKVTGGTANRTVSLESSRLEAYEGDVLKNAQNKAVNDNVKVDIKDNNMPSVIGLDEEQQDDIVEVTLKLKMPKGILEKFLEKFEKWLQQINQDNKWSVQLLEN